jgi:hypothetical protein
MKTSPTRRRTPTYLQPPPAQGCHKRYPSIFAYSENESGCDAPSNTTDRLPDFLRWKDFIFWIRQGTEAIVA